MKDHELLDAIGYIDPKYVGGSNETGEQKARPIKKRVGIIAAGLGTAAVIAAAVFLALKPGLTNDGMTALKAADKETTAAISETDRTENLSTEPPAEGKIIIPAVELPETGASEVSYDMIGTLVYRGGVYLQAEMYVGGDADRLEPIIGDYLGHAVGTIDEWSTQEEYSKELASTYTGEVYTVKGYDPEFRVCIMSECEGEDHEAESWIIFMERLNGISVSFGRDVFEDRLHLSGHISTVEYQAHDDWNYNKGNICECGVDPDVWERFMQEIDSAEFEEIIWTNGSSFYEAHANSSIYDTPNQAHLFLRMDDGTTAGLRLIEGGYVRYDAFGFYCFVKIPGETFDAVYDACGGTHLTVW